MTLIHRIGYYLGGFSLGLILLAFFLSGKKTSCSYGLDARVIKNINTKKIEYSDHAKSIIEAKHLDTIILNHVLHKGDVNFSKSNTSSEPCKTYYLNGTLEKKTIALIVKNCKETATVEDIEILK
ncbi:DUF4258 domain-containing protein [Formosa sediminum]|uniref:DUF4258 domain-containing protein n=1 Tax=Formosa sediminum TaxID=2594004 RepID=A0A516GU13_9FLAO|nr:DUF4258 domain-containing protein [Formosa sediminum]QDO95016.1 DUF4258 domain-containing protein [Formosa sediminum]